MTLSCGQFSQTFQRLNAKSDCPAGEAGNDTLTGNGGADTLRGGDGDDVLTAGEENLFSDFSGGDGNDSITVIAGDAFIQPGTGDDTITGSGGDNDFNEIAYIYDAQDADPAPTNGIVVVYDGEGSGTVTDYAGGTDTFTNIDAIRGTQLADSFTGSDGRDRFTGLAGDDTFDGGGGDRDQVDYRWSQFADGAAGVTVDLTAGTATDPFGDTDTLINIEDIRGTVFDDVMFGATGAESRLEGDDGNDSLTGADDDFFTDLDGGDGDDTLDGGTGGAFFEPGTGTDVIIGGTADEGFFALSYFFSARDEGATSGITVQFSSERDGTVVDYNGDTDTFEGIDRIRGTNNDDSFTGAEGRQQFRGLGGDDFFDGGAGDRDRIDYSRADESAGASQGVVVDMVNGTATDAYGDTDTFVNIEEIRGSKFDDVITGDDQDNFLEGEGGDDTLDGGAGNDGAGYDASQSSFTLTIGPSGLSLADRSSDGTGTDQIANIEFLDFYEDGGSADIRGFETLTSLSAEAFEDLIELYIAYFNRAPDAEGLYFWGTAVANNISLSEIAALFIDQDETRAAYPDTLSNEDFATTVYANVLGRVADQDGFDFWVNALNSGGVGRDVFILEVLKGAKADPQPDASQAFIDQQLADRQYLEDKTDVGAYFAVHKGMSDVGNASAAMALFDGSEDSIADAVAAIDAFHADALDAETGEFLMPLVGVIDDPFAVA
jgi:cold shock CspA family protein